MKLPKGTIFVSVVLTACTLVLCSGVGAAGTTPLNGNSPSWHIGAQQENNGGGPAPDNSGTMPPGGPDQSPGGNSTAPGPGWAGMNGTPEFFDRGNMTPIDNRTPMELDNMSIPLNGTHRMHGNLTSDNRTPPAANVTQPLASPANGNGGQPGQENTGGQGSGADSGQKSPIDELIAALTRFFSHSS